MAIEHAHHDHSPHTRHELQGQQHQQMQQQAQQPLQQHRLDDQPSSSYPPHPQHHIAEKDKQEHNHMHGRSTVGGFRHDVQDRDNPRADAERHSIAVHSNGPNDESRRRGGPSDDGRHLRIRSAPHSLHVQAYSSSELDHQSLHSGHISHHPNAVNRFPFSIPPVSAKLDQPHHANGDDALSSLWKVSNRDKLLTNFSADRSLLFSLDEVPHEFNKDMYIAMRNRIFELEAKSVDYSPFSHSRKRSMERSGYDYSHPSSKRTAYQDPAYHSHRQFEHERQKPTTNLTSSSYPSWYTPEVYSNSHDYSPPPPHPPRSYKYNGTHDSQAPDEREERGLDHPRSSPSRGYPPPHQYSSPPPGSRGSQTQMGHHDHPKNGQGALSSSQYTENNAPSRQDDQRMNNGASSLPENSPAHAHSFSGSQRSQHPPPSENSHPSTHHSRNPATMQNQPPPPQSHPQQPQHTGHRTIPQPIQPAPPTSSQSVLSNSTAQQRQSFHQQQHRAQQQAQSAHSRSYHLQKHMRMLDQQRAAQLVQQQQQQQTQGRAGHQGHSAQSAKSIQRHYQPHQQMYPQHQPIAIKPYPHRPQANAMVISSVQRTTQSAMPHSGQTGQGQHTKPVSIQQQMIQRYQQQRALQQKQQQLRQLQYMRNRATTQISAQKESHPNVGISTGSHSPTPPRIFGPQVDRPIKKAERPLECSNCLALDSLKMWRPKSDTASNSNNPPPGGLRANEHAAGSKLLCSSCIQHMHAHGVPRPVPPFRTNFLKKIHTRFKRELQEVRFQGWQDAQVLEIEDKMTENEFQTVFSGLDQSDPSKAAERHKATAEQSSADSNASESSQSKEKEAGDIIIKIEDDDDDDLVVLTNPRPAENEVRTFQTEASVGELFGQRWRAEPVVGYTLVHFGGSDRTRMVPMNPTVPSLTVTFNRKRESITFAFRVLVNGLCLLSSGGGPPALHMPEMADEDDESEVEDEVVAVPDNDKHRSPTSTPSTEVAASATVVLARPTCSGKHAVANLLVSHYGFTQLGLQTSSEHGAALERTTETRPRKTFDTIEQMLDFVTLHWMDHFVTIPNDGSLSAICNTANISPPSLEEFVEATDQALYTSPQPSAVIEDMLTSELSSQDSQESPNQSPRINTNIIKIGNSHMLAPAFTLLSMCDLVLLNYSSDLEILWQALKALDVTNPDLLRPSWDSYFMYLANLAARRSNCMKRRVGCVLVREKRVIATGYNGTPKNLKNCNDGGCSRCNAATPCGKGLDRCLCMHAEENALLEAGRERVGQSSTIYCNTCPCLGCAIKIVQVGVCEVVYSESYGMDDLTAEVFRKAGVVLRQHATTGIKLDESNA
ncbi:Deoxycytidine monophosphate (dCMP) deaminase [Podila humilis]|nr:Deoxycytidine monophosphate (dCMP) deaminase [Podila humilis]